MTQTTLDLEALYTLEYTETVHLACPHCEECVCGAQDKEWSPPGLDLTCEICVKMDKDAEEENVLCSYCNKDIGWQCSQQDCHCHD